MSFSGPSKTCPRCNSVLPAQAAFCGTCGLQFSASAVPGAPPPPASSYSPGPSQYSGGSPGGWPPPSQPGYPPPGGQPGYAGYPGAVAAPPRQGGGAGKIIVLVLVLVVLLGGGGVAWFLFLSPSHTNSPFFDRHGLQSNVPLPNNTTFKLKRSVSETDPDTKVTISGDAWAWTVDGSDPTAVQQFYKDNLPKNGWSKIQTFNDSGEKDLTACQGGQILFIIASTKLEVTNENGKVTDTINAPSGGTALATELSSTPQLVQILCSEVPIVPTP